MVGRVSFVILSGIVAAAALVHVLPKDNSADLAGGAKIVPQIVGAGELNADVGTHEAVVVAMDRVEMSQLRALEKAKQRIVCNRNILSEFKGHRIHNHVLTGKGILVPAS